MAERRGASTTAADNTILQHLQTAIESGQSARTQRAIRRRLTLSAWHSAPRISYNQLQHQHTLWSRFTGVEQHFVRFSGSLEAAQLKRNAEALVPAARGNRRGNRRNVRVQEQFRNMLTEAISSIFRDLLHIYPIIAAAFRTSNRMHSRTFEPLGPNDQIQFRMYNRQTGGHINDNPNYNQNTVIGGLVTHMMRVADLDIDTLMQVWILFSFISLSYFALPDSH